MEHMTAVAITSAAAATRKPKSRRVAGSRAIRARARRPTAGKAAIAAPAGGDLSATAHSDCISETLLNHRARTVGSIIAKGPARQRGSTATKAAAATAPAAATPAARTGQPAELRSRPARARPSVAAINPTTELIAMASHAVRPQCAGPRLAKNATATLPAAQTP